MAEYAAKAGASALVLSPPYYFNLSQAAFLGYLERLVPLLPLPVYLYNIPSLTKLMIAPETVRGRGQMPNVYGLKDSSGDVDYFARVQSLMADRPDFALLAGVEEILAEMVARGAHGGVCGGANLYPRLYVDLFEAAARGDVERVRTLQSIVITISNGVYSAGEHGVVVPSRAQVRILDARLRQWTDGRALLRAQGGRTRRHPGGAGTQSAC